MHGFILINYEYYRASGIYFRLDQNRIHWIDMCRHQRLRSIALTVIGTLSSRLRPGRKPGMDGHGIFL